MGNESSFHKLMVEVQKEVGTVKKTSDNPHFRSSYADINEVLRVVLPVLNSKGLRLYHCVNKECVTTGITDGHQHETTTVYFSGNEQNMQQIGAAITYARRFGIVSLLSLEQEDDDGETAVGRGKAPAPKAAPKASALAAKTPMDRVQVVSSGPIPVHTSPGAIAPVATPAPAPEQPPLDRALCIKTVKMYCKVAVDQKKKTSAEIVSLISSLGAPKVDQLGDSGLETLLTKLKEIVNG
jgi:hypothetical protein